MDSASNRLALYQSLRAEIAQADNQNYQVLGFAVAATAALVTAGVAQDTPVERSVVFALVFLVTWPCQRLLQGKRRLVWRIASYLRVVVEPHLDGVDWETHLSKLPRNGRSARMLSTQAAYNEWLIITVLNATAGVCLIGLAVLPAATTTPVKALLVVLVVLVWAMLSVGMRVTDIRLARGRTGGINALYETTWQTVAPATPDVSTR